MKIEKALVVDDSKVAHLSLRKLLTQRGVEVDWVGSGEQCLEYLKRQKPDVVFMDVMMPGMDGFDTTGLINSHLSAAPPVVICSANATDEDRQTAEKNGAVDFLSKPYTQDKLDQILNNVAVLRGDDQSPADTSTPSQSDIASPGAPAPAPEIESRQTPEPVQAPAVDLAEITAKAQHVAQETAEETARRMVSELARLAAEKTIRIGVEKAEAVAREMARQVAGDAAREIAEGTARVVGQKAAQEVSERLLDPALMEGSRNTPDSGELRQILQAELNQQLPQALGNLLADEVTQKQLASSIIEVARPLVSSVAREAASETVRKQVDEYVEEATGRFDQEADDGAATALARSNLALASGIIALVASASVALKFFL
jgi:CheY-like chemotaxis protein